MQRGVAGSECTKLIGSAKVSVVLPTMNEMQNVRGLCSGLHYLKQHYAELAEAIFVLDNSRDGTADVLQTISKEPGYEFVKLANSESAGGSAIRKDVELAEGQTVVVMDSDGQYDPQQIPELLRPIPEDGYFISVGRNYGWANFPRRIISEAFKKLAKILLGVEYVQTVFKAGIRDVLIDTIPDSVPGLDIDVRWTDNVMAKGYSSKLCDAVAVRLRPRVYGKTT